MSGHGDQRSADLAVLRQQDVVGACRGARLHDVEPDPGSAKTRPPCFWESRDIEAGAEQQQFKFRALLENRRKALPRDIRHRSYGPGENAGRQHEDRAAMGHLGETKTAIAIGVDQVTPGHEAFVNPAAPTHRAYSAGATLPPTAFVTSELRRPI